VRRPPMKWSAITESLRNTVLPASSIEEACTLSCASDNEASFKTPSSTDLLQKLPVAHPVKKLPVFYATARFMNGQWSASRPGRALDPGKGPPVPIGQEARVKYMQLVWNAFPNHFQQKSGLHFGLPTYVTRATLH
jgi:hypothetical protein